MQMDVVIAGAGPVGLFLACELRLAGVGVLVLEQAEEPDSPLKRLPFGRRGLWTPTLEAFYRRGLLEPLVAALGQPDLSDAHWARGPRRPSGHFAGIPLFEDGQRARPWHLPGPAPDSLMVDTLTLETVLAQRAIELGVEIRRGRAVETVENQAEAVTIKAGDQTIEGAWLVGCDGGRSAVRKSAGFEFVGSEPEFTGYSVLVELEDPQALPQGRHYTLTGMFTYAQSGARPGNISMADFDGAAFHRAQPITREHVQTVLRRISGVEVEVRVLHQFTTFTDRAYQATTYRNGRVLLAGDAAHVHSPLGGQGLNLGLGDAMNLGWKLAATVEGRAPEGLLDSYECERHPVGAAVLDWSRAQVALMRPSRSARALEAIVRDLIDTADGTAYFADRVGSRRLRYDLGDAHPLVGRSAPDFELADGSRLGHHLRRGRGVMLDFESMLPELASVKLEYLAMDARDRLGLSALLIRPDGVVAWAAPGPPDQVAVQRAISRWFGA